MARKRRVDVPGYCYHVITRGNNRQACFDGDEDYSFYLDCLAQSLTKYEVDLHAYVLMTNHVHLLLTPNKLGALAGLMQSLGRRYVRYFNHVYQRSGTLWEGRYKASVIDSDRYCLTCYRYIELNPVRAGMVQRPSEYKWSSARWHGWGIEDGVRPEHSEALIPQKRDESKRNPSSKATPTPLIKDHSLYMALGQTAKERQYRYRGLFRMALDKEEVQALNIGIPVSG